VLVAAAGRLQHLPLGRRQEMPEVEPFRNGYRAGWELFLKHVAEDAPFPAPFLEGAKSVQLAEACYQSHLERRWVDLPKLNL
jgi:predicted dehydrogenase